ncbi:MAG: hypothetical protein COA79_18185 [Planctomycetota bacterium]|nr:MAG: hypothetical protein COA79_18185 [Planctomycetota bacterium]
MVDSKLVTEMVEYYEKLATRYETKGGLNKPPSKEAVAYWDSLFACFKDKLADRDILEIASGTGLWTSRLADIAKSVIATELNESTLIESKKKPYPPGVVTFILADAYTLENVGGPFNAGFAKDWFSHIPKSRIDEFFNVFHSKLKPGATVVISDTYQPDSRVPNEPGRFSHIDEEGNVFHNRLIPDDPNKKTWNVIKNCPSEKELRKHLKNGISNFEYHVHKTDFKHLSWYITYTVN